MNAQTKKDDAVLPHHFISLAIAATGKSNQEIADEIGIPRGNVIAMIRSGSMKLPINRVAAMAKAIEVDPSPFCGRSCRMVTPKC